jgi:hypothetical protein
VVCKVQEDTQAVVAKLCLVECRTDEQGMSNNEVGGKLMYLPEMFLGQIVRMTTSARKLHYWTFSVHQFYIPPRFCRFPQLE